MDGRAIYQLLMFANQTDGRVVEFERSRYRVSISTGGQNLVFYIQLLDVAEGADAHMGGDLAFFRHYDLNKGRFLPEARPQDLELFNRFVKAMIEQGNPAVRVLEEVL